ncbi:MAG: hypothetical protein M3P49_02250 [Actinomycetota bacterium]|nr:hypothetical protein [Actinomycetota bacterium]
MMENLTDEQRKLYEGQKLYAQFLSEALALTIEAADDHFAEHGMLSERDALSDALAVVQYAREEMERREAEAQKAEYAAQTEALLRILDRHP